MYRLILISIFFLAGFIVARGQEISTDRPDQTESSTTIPYKSFQIESGIVLGYSKTDGANQREFIAPGTLMRYGVLRWFEIRLVNQFSSIKNLNNSDEISGINDLETGFKLQLYKKENSNTEVAFLSHVVFPTGNENFSGDIFGTVNKLAISHVINPKYEFAYNLGYNYLRHGIGDLFYSLVLGIGINEKVGIYIETYGDLEEFNHHHLNFDGGITYLLKDNFQLDFSFGTGINNEMNYLSLGFGWNIKGN